MAARCLKDVGARRRGDLILETVVDEEFGGANGTLACRLRGYNAAAAVIAEPTGLVVSASHRGGKQYRLHATGRELGMSFAGPAQPDAITALGHAAVALEAYNQERNLRPKPPGFEDDSFPLMPFAMRAGEVYSWGAQDAMPGSGWLEFWIEVPPAVNEHELDAELAAVVQNAVSASPAARSVALHLESRLRFLPGSGIAADAPLVMALATNLAAATGRQAVRGPAPFACDAFVFNHFSPTPCAILGPRGGNAHAPDEWVYVDDLIALTKAFALTMAEWLI
jgi:acetylornithine deacetylase